MSDKAKTKRQIKMLWSYPTIILAIVMLSLSCTALDYKGELMRSPNGKYFIQAKVNRSSKVKMDYGIVVIHLFDQNEQILDSKNSHVGDFGYWELDWSFLGDFVILKNSDRGDIYYKVSEEQKLISVKNILKPSAN